MPNSVFQSKSLMTLSNKDFALQQYQGYREDIEENVFGKGADIIHEGSVFCILRTAGHVQLPQAATDIFTEFMPNRYVVTSISVSHKALYVLMYVVTALITLPECVHQLAKLHQ